MLSIVGQVNSANSGQLNSANSLSKVGVLIFLAAWAGLAFLVFSIASRLKQIEPGERKLVTAVGLSTPLLFVRVVYSLLAAFSNNSDFNMLTGNPTIMLVMAVLEEIIICVVCLGTGLTLHKQECIEHDESFVPVR